MRSSADLGAGGKESLATLAGRGRRRGLPSHGGRRTARLPLPACGRARGNAATPLAGRVLPLTARIASAPNGCGGDVDRGSHTHLQKGFAGVAAAWLPWG